MKAILEQLAGPIRVWGYRGSGQNFRRVVGDIVFVVNFQKSRSGDHFFVNLGGQPTAIPDNREGEPNPKTLKEYDCVFRLRLHGDWSTVLERTDTARLIAAIDDARRSFESKVLTMRDLSREGRGEELLDHRAYLGTAARAPLVLARLLAADGHSDVARKLAEHAIASAGEAALLRAAAQRLIASLPDH